MTLTTGPASSATLTPRRDPAGTRGLRAMLRGIGELFITCGLVVLLFVVYLLWWTDVKQHHSQQVLARQLEQEWAQPPRPGPVLPADALAFLFVPRLGAKYREVVVQGADLSLADGDSKEDVALQKGPAHYPETPMFGEMGNVAVAGHRVTYGHPFNRLDDLHPGDEIVFDTRDAWFTYKAVSMEQVTPDQVEVAQDVPPTSPAGTFSGVAWPETTFHAGQHLLTFTTCTPPHSATYRLVLHAELVAVDEKAGNPVDFTPLAVQPGHGLADDHDRFPPLT